MDSASRLMLFAECFREAARCKGEHHRHTNCSCGDKGNPHPLTCVEHCASLQSQGNSPCTTLWRGTSHQIAVVTLYSAEPQWPVRVRIQSVHASGSSWHSAGALNELWLVPVTAQLQAIWTVLLTCPKVRYVADIRWPLLQPQTALAQFHGHMPRIPWALL